jgi:glycine cleavage system H protein
MAPERRYSRDHTWAERRDGALLVGLTAYAIDRLGTLVHLTLSVTPDQRLAPGEIIGNVESDKAVVDLFTPVGGRVLAVHEDLAHDPARLHDDCYGEGWLLRLAEPDPGDSLAHRDDFAGLLDASQYNELLKARPRIADV